MDIMVNAITGEISMGEAILYCPHIPVREVKITGIITLDTLTPEEKVLEKEGLAFKESMKVI